MDYLWILYGYGLGTNLKHHAGPYETYLTYPHDARSAINLAPLGSISAGFPSWARKTQQLCRYEHIELGGTAFPTIS